jgi:ribonuclease HI
LSIITINNALHELHSRNLTGDFKLFDLPEREKLIIYSDGSVTPGNNGGVGIRMISIDSNGDEVINDSYSAGYRNVESGQIEIIACTAALEEAIRLQLTLFIKNVVVLTDAKYVCENYRKAMFEWSQNKWLRKTGRPIPDAHLWKELVNLIIKFNKEHVYVEIRWVKGHEKDEHNKAVDKMARRASKLPLEKISKIKPTTMYIPRKVISSPKMERGCVNMEGQRISIKILSAKLLQPQNIWCYQYQVISKKSSYFGLVDQIYSFISLDINKSYFVRFNFTNENPRIEKTYREIK